MSNAFEAAKKRFASVKGWTHLMRNKSKSNHANVLETFEESYMNLVLADEDNYADIDPNAEPINILCLDGGGMRGYAHLAILQAINDHYLGPGQQDLIGQFDLIAGTSVGGVASLIFNQAEDLKDTILEGRDVLDDIRENCFKKISLLTLCCTGALVEKEHHILSILEKRYQGPLKRDGIPAFALIAAKVDEEEQDGNVVDFDESDFNYEALIARTYEYPNDSPNTKPLAKSTCSMKMFEAMSATSAVPPLVDRVRAIVDGRMRTMADGGIFQICPLSLAIDEARRLYPRRPLGVILNFGFNDQEEKFIERTITTARMANPNLHFQRISAEDITGPFSSAETDLEKVTIMEEKVKQWMADTPRVRNLTKLTLKKLFETKPRNFKKDKEEPSKSKIAFKNKAFLRRSLVRDKVRMRYSVFE
jgi:predicted acylesterase/phospholipase RssA